MRRQAAGVKEESRIEGISEYGRQRLLNYAESFHDLADLFEEKEEDKPVPEEQGERQEYLYRRRLQESRGLLAEHLKEMAHIMATVARETCQYHPLGERRFKIGRASCRERVLAGV